MLKNLASSFLSSHVSKSQQYPLAALSIRLHSYRSRISHVNIVAAVDPVHLREMPSGDNENSGYDCLQSHKVSTHLFQIIVNALLNLPCLTVKTRIYKTKFQVPFQ